MLAGAALILLLGIVTRKKTMDQKIGISFFQVFVIPLVYLTSLLLSYVSFYWCDSVSFVNYSNIFIDKGSLSNTP